jgi:spore maturation protein CgeB
MLHEDTPELRQAFHVGDEVGAFVGEQDLANQVTWWLQHDTARKSAAEAAFLRASTQPYTYARAVDTVLAWHAQKNGNV